MDKLSNSPKSPAGGDSFSPVVVNVYSESRVQDDGRESSHEAEMIIIPDINIKEESSSSDSDEDNFTSSDSAKPAGASGFMKIFLCEICGKTFKRKENMTHHTKTVHEKIANFPCLTCGKSFRVRSHLKRHEVIHTGQQPYSCSSCNKSFYHKESLTYHLRKFHQDNDSSCNTLSAGNRHHGLEDRPFKCPDCGLGFAEKKNVLAHTRNVHHGDFDCKHCGETFGSRGLLTTHVQSRHSVERPYVCPECEKTFSRKDTLDRHLLTHKGVKPFQCDVCSKTFARKSHLKSHSATHEKYKRMITHAEKLLDGV